jgi:hypothetical protein
MRNELEKLGRKDSRTNRGAMAMFSWRKPKRHMKGFVVVSLSASRDFTRVQVKFTFRDLSKRQLEGPYMFETSQEGQI